MKRPALLQAPSPSRAPLFAALGLALLLVALYLPVLRAPLIFDDAEAITRNPSIQRFSTALQPPALGGTTHGRPVLNFSFALTYALGGDRPAAHRAANLLLHAAAALLVFALARRAFARAWPRPDQAPWLAFALAALWSLHPLTTSTVSVVAQRSEGLFSVLLLLVLYATARTSEAATPAARRGWLALALAASALGMGAKEVMVVAPLLALAYDRAFLAGSWRTVWTQRRALHLGLAATWLVLAAILISTGGTRGHSAGLGLSVTPWSYLLTQAGALVAYLRLSLWPDPLVLDYGMAVTTTLGDALAPGALVLALLGATLWAWRSQPALGFVGLWFFVVLAPSSSVVPLVSQTVAEHRMYLPLLAPVTLIVLACVRWASRATRPLLGLLCVLAAVGSVLRNRDYHSAVGIWADTAAGAPSNPRAWLNWGVELHRAGQPAEAMPKLDRALALDPASVSAHYSRGAVLLALGREAEALVALETAVRLGPTHADARFALGNAYAQAGRTADAIAQLEESLRLAPADDVRARLADVRHRHALTLARAGRFDEAAAHWEAALAVRPDHFDACANLGNVRLLQRRSTEAVALFRRALELRPGDARVRANLDLALQSSR